MDRPTLQQLQEIANRYFKNNPPEVKWFDNEDKPEGEAHYDDNVIYLNKKIAIKQTGCTVGGSAGYKHKDLKLKEGEQYYFVLLHEIAHFLFKPKMPKSFIDIKAKLVEAYPDNLEKQLYEAEDYIKQNKGESDDEWVFRVEEFKSYLRGDLISNHMEVEDWAIKEFKNIKEIGLKMG